MFLRNHVTQWLVITRWSGTLVVSGVDWTCDTAVQCFDPLSSHRPNSLIYETRQRNSTPSAFISSVETSIASKKKVSTFVSKLGSDRTRPTDMVLPRTPRRAKEPAKYLAHIGEKGRYVVFGKDKQILLQQ